jgi:HK97 family phage major capsid protein
MKIKDLKAHKAKLVQEMRSLAENDKLDENQETRFNELKKDLEATEKRIDRQEYIDTLERQAAPVDNPEFDQEKRSYSIQRAIAGASGFDVDFGREKEISQELARRSGKQPGGIWAPVSVFETREVITTTAPAAGPGGNIIPTDYRPGQYIDLLRAKLITRARGARVLSGLNGNVSIPRLKASATGYWVAENSAITASDMQFDELTMSPKHCGCLVEFSRNMLMQASPDIENLIRMDFASLLARAIDGVALEGGGSNEPTGITETSGVNAVDVSVEYTWAKILEFIESVETDNAEGSGWCATPAVVKTLRSTRKTVNTNESSPPTETYVDSQFLMEMQNRLAGSPYQLAGFPLKSSTSVPTGQLIFGNWADLLIGYWSQFDLLVNPYESTAYSKGNVQVRGMLTADVAVRHPVSFCISTL